MQFPDLSNAASGLNQYMPEVLFATVDEAAHANREKIAHNVAFYKANPRGIQTRLEELDEEWDVDKVLQVATGGASIASFWFSLTKTRLWSLVPAILGAGALHYGITGQSPAADLVRRLGFRTRDEIEGERIALLAVRGDFAGLGEHEHEGEMATQFDEPAMVETTRS